MAPKNFLNNVTIPSPCSADWNSMVGNDQVRFCNHCNLDVHNLSQMTRSQAERLVSRANGRLCVQYHHDRTGRPLTLPVAQKLQRQKLHRIARRVSQVAAGAFTATLSVTSAMAQQPGSSQSASLNPPVATQAIARWQGSSVSGTITDEKGAVIAGATISIRREELSTTLYASTDFNGMFRIDNLEQGYYTIRIEAPGFVANDGDSLWLRPRNESRIDRQLKVAAIGETGEAEETEVQTFRTGGAVAFVAPAHPFIRAAQEDNLEALAALIAGMDVNLRDKRSGTTALEHAAKNSNREMTQLLLSKGATVNARNASGETVLMMLDDDATSDLVWDLINAGADVNLKDEGGNTALMQAASSESLETLRVLLDAGAAVDAKNKEGRTALMIAASDGNVNIVRALVLAGADINALDEDKKDALALAVESDHSAVVRLLKSKGAIEMVARVEKEK